MENSTVFVNGTFDVIHKGHIELFNYAKSLGTHLIVAIDSDRRVKIKKGPTRPINCETERKYLLENLKAIDEVRIFDCDESLSNIIKNIQPNIMVVGSDWQNKKVIGSRYAKKLIFFERIDGYSTTQKIQDIIIGR